MPNHNPYEFGTGKGQWVVTPCHIPAPNKLLTFLCLSVNDFQCELVGQTDLFLLHNSIPKIFQRNMEALKSNLFIVQATFKLEVNTGHRSKMSAFLFFFLLSGLFE